MSNRTPLVLIGLSVLVLVVVLIASYSLNQTSGVRLLLTAIAVSYFVLLIALIGLYLANGAVDESDVKRSQ
jgi:hypothetical protein